MSPDAGRPPDEPRAGTEASAANRNRPEHTGTTVLVSATLQTWQVTWTRDHWLLDGNSRRWQKRLFATRTGAESHIRRLEWHDAAGLEVRIEVSNRTPWREVGR